jgi:hypothetical protein
MSRADDRIPVPTNGHRPPLAPDIDLDDEPVDPSIPVVGRRGVAIDATPAQLAVVFGAIMWLIVFLRGRRRRGG